MNPLVKDTDNIRLGIIGLTEGNYHPYSWSAIINGYNREKMSSECPVKVIPEYLNREPESSFNIKNAKVTHIFCDNIKDAEHTAECSLIPNVVKNPEDMAGAVDAVIIATDIGSEHVRRARPFIEAGIPLFIDKPLCDNLDDLRIFKRWVVDEGKKIISSSGLRYSKEFIPYQLSTNSLGRLRLVMTAMCKYWETYGIHAVEPIFTITGPGYLSVQNTGTAERNIVHLIHEKEIDVVISCSKKHKAGPVILIGDQDDVSISTKDTFFAFRKQMQSFIDYLVTGQEPHPFAHTIELMKIIAAGIMSREAGGKKIYLKEIEL